MDLLKSYTLVENKDGYDLILYLDTGTADWAATAVSMGNNRKTQKR